jgi:hypothetical protein
MTVNIILVALLIISISIALILYVLSKFLPQSESLKPEDLAQFSANMQKIKDGVDELRKTFVLPGKNNKKRPMIFEEIAEIKRFLSERILSGQSLLNNEGDGQFLSEKISEIQGQIGSLNEITHRIDTRSDRSAEVLDLQEKIRRQLDAMPAAFKQTFDEDEQFLEDLSSKLVPQIEAKLNPISLDQGQMKQISDMMNTSYEVYLQMFRDLLNSPDHKMCKKCNKVVPKNAVYCHLCAHTEFYSSDSPLA